MIWPAILRFITGGGLAGIADRLADAYEVRQKAQTHREKLQADMAIARLEARRDALVTGQGAWVSKVVQALWAAPFVLYTWKLIVWDKILGWGTTDGLESFETNIAMIIVSFYFLTVSIRSLKQ